MLPSHKVSMVYSSSRQRPALTSFTSSSSPKWNYDVFVSFKGDDTRKNFVDHLYAALKQRGIRVFRDVKELKRGCEISLELVRAIQESRFSIIVFSKNYAFSTWCLDELVKIMDCTKKIGQIALPIFYNVDPSDVRKQRGNYARAFAIHEKCIMEFAEKVRRWRAALSLAANLSGWDSRDRYESELIEEIVEEVSKRLNIASPPHLDDEHLVGMDSLLKEMTTRLRMLLEDVKFVYNQICNQFRIRSRYSFVVDEKEISSEMHLISLHERFLFDIDILIVRALGLRNFVRNKYRKDLANLYKVDHIDKYEKLAEDHDWFGSGTRHNSIIKAWSGRNLLVDDEDNSIEVLKQNLQPPPEDHHYVQLSGNVVDYADGLLLPLKVLGSSLCGRSGETDHDEGETELGKPNMNPDEDYYISSPGFSQDCEAEVDRDRDKLWHKIAVMSRL